MRYKSRTKAQIHDLGVMLGQAGVEIQGRREYPLRSPPNTCTSKVCGTASLEACNNSTSAMQGIEGLGKTLQQGKKNAIRLSLKTNQRKSIHKQKNKLIFYTIQKSGMITVFSSRFQ